MRMFVWSLVAGLMLGTVSNAFGGFVLGTFDVTRGGVSSLDGGSMTDEARASLLANFDVTVSSSSTLTPAYLSSVDILVLCNALTTETGIIPLSAAEQTALHEFVLSGGGVAIVADGYTDILASQSMLSPFGIVIEDDLLSGVQFVSKSNPAHPVFTGPFGDTPILAVYGAGILTDLGPYATELAYMDSTGLPVMASIAAGALGPGSGPVFVVTDATLFADTDQDGWFPAAEPLFLNTIDYLIVPEPAGSCLAAMGMLAVAAYGCSRRHV